MEANPDSLYAATLDYTDDCGSSTIRVLFRGNMPKPIKHKGDWDLVASARYELGMYWGLKLPKGTLKIFELKHPILQKSS